MEFSSAEPRLELVMDVWMRLEEKVPRCQMRWHHVPVPTGGGTQPLLCMHVPASTPRPWETDFGISLVLCFPGCCGRKWIFSGETPVPAGQASAL